MALHFIHIGKTGGTAIKHAIREAGKPDTSYGPVRLHKHRFTLDDVPQNHHVFFCVRDPIARFTSGFYSRLRRGQPRYYFEWSRRETEAFERFPTPQALATALSSDDPEERAAAAQAMMGIRHVRRHMHHWVTGRLALSNNRSRIAYISRLETLSEDWPILRTVVGLPDDLQLPTDPATAHRGDPSEDRSLDEKARAALRVWYRKDYRVLEFCDQFRRERGWDSVAARAPASDQPA